MDPNLVGGHSGPKDLSTLYSEAINQQNNTSNTTNTTNTPNKKRKSTESDLMASKLTEDKIKVMIEAATEGLRREIANIVQRQKEETNPWQLSWLDARSLWMKTEH